jgi:hypothetical protein
MRFFDFNSLHDGRSRRAAVAALAIAAQLAACSGNTGSSLTPMGASSTAAMLTHTTAGSNAVRPPEELCEPVVYVGTGWQYEGGTINEWYEFSGNWADIGGRLVPCSSTPIAKDPINPFWNAFWGEVVLTSYWFQVQQCFQYCFASTSPYSNVVTVYTYRRHHEVQVGSVNTAPYLPIGLAVSSKGTLYVSVIPPQGGKQSSGILVYPKGQTSPSGMLTDSHAGQNAETIAVDKSGNLYAAYTSTESSRQVAHIDKFPGGKSNAVSFAVLDGVEAGAIAATAGGDVVASTIASSSGEIQIFSAKGQTIGKFATTSDPTSISINKKNNALTVSDAANNLVSNYAYPSGTLQSQLSLGSPSQMWEPGGMIAP